MKHPIKLEGYNGTLDELARDIMNMRYDKVSELIYAIARYAKEDGDSDAKRPSIKNPKKKRRDLASKLHNFAKSMEENAAEMDDIWEICKEYMDNL